MVLEEEAATDVVNRGVWFGSVVWWFGGLVLAGLGRAQIKKGPV